MSQKERAIVERRHGADNVKGDLIRVGWVIAICVLALIVFWAVLR